MSYTPLYREKFHRPEVNLAELLRKNAGGLFRERDELVQFMFRALVISIDHEGGNLENPDGVAESSELDEKIIDQSGKLIAQYKVKARVGPRNPPGSIRARVVSPDIDSFSDFDNLRTYWPIFPGLQSPTAGELVYVVFEDENASHGLWLSKVSTNSKSDNPNLVLMRDTLVNEYRSKVQLFDQTEDPSEVEQPYVPSQNKADLFP